MKIYNKKTFWYGIGFIVLGTLQLMISIWKGFDLKGTVMMILCLLIGGSGLLRSFSREMSREDKIAELDERNRLVEWRAKSCALGIAELVCFVCMLLSIFGMQAMEAFFGGMLVAFGLIFTTMLIIECITLLYYNKKL